MENHVTIIAEAGVNHNGSLENALELIRKGAEAGVDYVKFQSFKAEKLVSKKAKKAAYQKENMNSESDSQLAMLKKLEIPEDWYPTLLAECEATGVRFLSTGFDHESLTFLNKIGIPFFKIPSGELTNKPYLELVASFGKPVILSTGMANLEEIGASIEVLQNGGIKLKDISVLHCNTQYPTPMEDVNLSAMNTIGEKYQVGIGYSDHTLGIEIPIAAVAMGATIIEKHFTLDNTMEGPDHLASLEPNELKNMTTAIRNISKALGDGKKTPSASEKPNIAVARKSIHLAKDIIAGTQISASDLIMMRPGDGINPMDIDSIIGKKAIKNLSEGDKLAWEDIQ